MYALLLINFMRGFERIVFIVRMMSFNMGLWMGKGGVGIYYYL